MAKANSQIRGTMAVALSGMLYGVLGYFGTVLLLQDFSVPAMLFWRFFIAALWMLGSIFFINKPKLFFSADYSAVIKMVVVGVITYSGSSIFYFFASQHIGTGAGMVIFFCYPVFVTLLTWLFTSWTMNKHTLLSLTAVIIGLVFLKGQGESALSLLGIGFAVIAAFCYAVYVYISQHSIKAVDAKLQTLFICIGNTIIFFALAAYSHTLMTPTTINAWIDILAVGIIATALPIQLLLIGLKYITPIKASILSVLEPIVTVIVGFLLLHETLSFIQLLGIMIILLGAIFIQFESVEQQEVIIEGP